jgi:superoxide dismutase, Cu-Zn family
VRVRPLLTLLPAAFLVGASASAAAASVEMRRVTDKGIGAPIGTVALEDQVDGLLVTPNLKGLPPGARGFHVHERGSCEPAEEAGQRKAAMAAGGHFDPAGSGRHAGPHEEGHLGDLPILYVRADGTARDAVLAPRPRLADFRGRALVVHAGGDNYADKPEEDGGGGERIACGVIP